VVAKLEPPLLVILGETASGKTALAIELAQRLNGEIICADAWTVYKGFDIGTAKPTQAERQGVPHHLLDIADPAEGFSAAAFQRMTNEAIANISTRGKLPIMVGGTGLYIDGVLFGYNFLPKPDEQLRNELDKMSLDGLIARAKASGFDISRVDTHNKRRVMRLIENNGQFPTKQSLREHTFVLGLHRSIEDLRQRIEQRVDVMIATGLVAEVTELSKKYGWECEPMKGSAYRAFRDYMRGDDTLEMAKNSTIQNDLQLAKKQRTYFRKNSSIHWIDYPCKTDDIVDLVTTNLNN
jgi:tRNA dimethylallyltransferase